MPRLWLAASGQIWPRPSSEASASAMSTSSPSVLLTAWMLGLPTTRSDAAMSSSDGTLPAVGLVDCVDDRLATPAQRCGTVVSRRQDSGPGIRQQDHQIGLLDSLPGLITGGGHDLIIGIIQSAGVHQNEIARFVLDTAIDAVTRDARHISHQGIAGAGQRIEKG